jgi:8-oxo-dGTP pyrophosphatase MutT (NUDIX family)
VVIRPAATLVLLREGAEGPEGFMLQRTAARGVSWVGRTYFPAGALDPADADPALLAHVTGLDPDGANARLQLPGNALSYWIAAVRETFEEAGILVASDEAGAPLDARTYRGARATPRSAQRAADVISPTCCAASGSPCPWRGSRTTSTGSPRHGGPRRFDTRFFMALAPQGQAGALDNAETVHSLWIRPADALCARRARRDRACVRDALRPERSRALRYRQSALDYARALNGRAVQSPVHRAGLRRREDLPARRCPVSRDPLDRSRRDDGLDIRPSCRACPGCWIRTSAHRRAESGMMTGPGTNTYIVGRHERAVIDPGPLVKSHVQAILQASEGPHPLDPLHAFAPRPLARRSGAEGAHGAQVVGCRPGHPQRHDTSFAPDVVPRDGERIALPDCTLRAIHTPGHASNHVCYLLEDTRMLFTGDHVMQGSTVVIDPPDGDMRAYLASLEALLALHLAIIAPGHGYLIGEPHREARRLIAHRHAREPKWWRRCGTSASRRSRSSFPTSTTTIDPRRHAVAARSLYAHLLKLVAEDRVTIESGQRYAMARDTAAPRASRCAVSAR